MLDSLRSLGTRGSKLIRLDAFGYATKTPGTRCFFQVSQLAASLYLCKFHLGICEGLKVPVKWLAIAHHHWLMEVRMKFPLCKQISCQIRLKTTFNHLE